MKELVIFAVLWAATFPLAWRILPNLLFVQPSSYKLGVFGWFTWRAFYMFIILLPYLALLAYTDIEGPIRSAILSVIFISFLSVVIKIFFANKITKTLWHIYGYVYDGLLNFYPYRNLIDKVVDRVKPAIKKNNSALLLDLGCGTGNLIMNMDDKGIKKAVGVDNSPSMLAKARKKLRGNDNVELIKSDLLEFLKNQEDNQVDIVTLVNVLYTQQEQTVFLQQIRRVLKQDGLLVISDPDREGNMPLMVEHLKNDSPFKLFNPKLIAVWIIDNFISALSKNRTFIFNNQADLIKLLQKSGFQVVGEVNRIYGGDKKGVNLILSCAVA